MAQWMRPAILFSSVALLFLGFNLSWWLLRDEPVLLYHLGYSMAWAVFFDLNGLLLLCGAFYGAVVIVAVRSRLYERRLRQLAVDEADRLVRQPRD